jgi:hypothetical protein
LLRGVRPGGTLSLIDVLPVGAMAATLARLTAGVPCGNVCIERETSARRADTGHDAAAAV